MKTILYEEGYPPALRETYLAMIYGSVDSDQYRKLYVRRPNGELIDVIKNGDLACAYFVSSILTLCGFIKDGVHTTVDETLRDVEASSWIRTDTASIGSLVVWKKRKCSDGTYHRHLGFFVGQGEVISNDAISGHPKCHSLIEKDIVGEVIREVETFYTYPYF